MDHAVVGKTNMLSKKACVDRVVCSAVAVFVLICGTQTAAGQTASAVRLDPGLLRGFLRTHCVKCHGPDQQQGETRLDTISFEITNSDVALQWQEVLDVLNLGEMPPEDQRQPAAGDLTPVLAHLTDSLAESRQRLAESGGDIALRRLNRREYRNTIDHLFGLRVPDELLPADDIAGGYDTVGQDQQFSTYHFEDYLAAGKTIAGVALRWADAPQKQAEVRTSEPETRGNANLKKYIANYDRQMAIIKDGGSFADIGLDDQKQLDLFLKRYDGRAGARQRYLDQRYTDRGVFLVEAGYFRAAGSGNIGVDPRASWKFRAIAGLRPEAPELRQFLKVSASGRTLGWVRVSGSLDHPSTHEIEHRPFLTERLVRIDVSENKGDIPIRDYVKQLPGGGVQNSTIWVDRVEWEGPLYPDNRSVFELIYRRAFGSDGKPEEQKNAADRKTEDSAARGFFVALMREAFRGASPSRGFTRKLLDVYSLNRSHGLGLKEALELPVAMVLSSPSFLYLMEDGPGSPEDRTIDDVEFAHRLSYFLWSRPADRKLLAAARGGKLSDADWLASQVKSMLRDSRSWALSEGFFTQWVSLDRLQNIAIDETIHLGFNQGVRGSSQLEIQHLFNTMIQENLSLTELIDSDFVVVNDVLALHYGLNLPATGDSRFRRVSLPRASARGGLLGTTAFLAMGSNGERSSPIIRGALLMEKFLDRKPADPPPNVPELALASDEPQAVMETIQLHREKAQCASCHNSFDPLGFGLENFDLLGQWRDREVVGEIGNRKRSKEIPIRASGTFPDRDQPYRNLDEFRAGLMERRHLLLRSMAEGLYSYGLGRHLEFADQQAIDEICEAAAAQDDRIGDLIVAVINHSTFRRGDRR